MNKKYKILKKILSIALCLALILPYTPMPVYAADCVVATEAEFMAALSDSSVDSITLSGDITISRSLDGNDNAFVIPRSVTITGGSLRVERGGIVLGGAVNFKDTEIYLANPVRNAIIANGYPLTLDEVSNGGSSFSIHLFCGGITDYTGGNVSEIPEAGVNGHITIRGENTLGNVYAGSFSDVGNGADDSPNDYTGTAIVTIENSANGFGEIYAHGAREDRSGGNGDGLLPDPELYKASGGVTINLNTPSTITVDGETGGSVDAALNYTDNGKGYRCEPVLKNIGNISLHTISEDEEAKLSPAQGSTFSKNGVIVTLPVNTRLDVTNLATDSSAIAISSLVGGGTLVLDEEQALTISGEVSGNTKVAVGDVSYTGDTCTGMPVEGQTYIVAEESADDNFSLLPPNSNSNMFLSKDNSGNWIIAVSEYTTIVNSISIPESNVEAVDNEGVEISATVMYSSTGDDYLSFVPFIVSVNDKAAEVTYNESYGYTYASGTTGSDIEFYFNIGYDDNEEILVVNNYGYENGIGTGTVPAGTYKISFTVPAENMASGEAYTFTVTLVVCEHAGGTADCTGQIFCEKCGLAYDSGEANAENHTRLTYTVSDNMLRAVCANSACGADCGSITLKTPAGDDLTYDGAAVEATVTSSIANVNPVITYTGDNLVDGKPVNVGEYVATVELGGEKISVAYEIQPAGLTVKNVTAAGRTYNSSNMVTITGVTLEGILLDDKVSVNVNALTGTLSSANAGDYNAVTLPTLALEGDDAKNYSLIQPIDAVATNVTIKKANPETAIHNIERSYLYLRSNVETINIVDLLPDDCGTLTYNISEITGNAEFDAEPAISEGVLTYTLKSGNIGDTASVNVTVITQNYENIMVVVKAELIDQTPVNLLDGTEVTLENNTLIYGEALSKLSFNSAVFVDADGNVVEGELAFREPSGALDVGTTSAEWVFTPDNEEYAQLKGTVNIFVKKATPFVATVPLASAIIYGDTLANSKLTGGIVQYGNGLGEAGSTECVEGTFAWKDNLVKPVVKDSNSTEYTVVFTPLDEVNYNSVETRVTLTVNKVKNPPNMPDSTVNVPYSSKVVDDITLPDGWIWQEADKNVVLEPEIPVGAIAVYTGIDKDNYENVSVEIIITRAECVHVTGEILFTGDGDKAPDCVDAGLGHKECTKCGKTVESGIVTDALGHELSKIEKVEATCTKTGSKEYWHCVVCEKKFGDDQGSKEITDMKVLEIPMEAHTGGTATCTEKAICDICKNEYGEVDITNHGEREVKNKKTATCKEPGYTGDTYCKECDTKIVSGKVIEKLITHSWDAGQVTKEATCTEKGETTYTCTVCEVTRTEEASALGHQLSKIGKVEATCAEKGKTIYACTVCGETTTEEIPALGHQLSKIGKVEATCVEKGKTTYACTDCGETTTEEIPALGHQLSKIEKVEATCTKTGSKEYWHCSVCEKKFSDDQGSKEITDMTILEIPMEAHTGGTATCTAKAICDICKNEYGELDITNHGEREVKNRKTATCKAPGYTGDTYCKECDIKMVSGEVIEKLTTHSWDAGKVTKEATCTEKGETTYTCTVCEVTRTEEVSALGHQLSKIGKVEATCAEKGKTIYACTVCGETTTEEIPALGHQLSKIGKVEATCVEKGKTTYACTDCGETTTEEIPALGHQLSKIEKVEATCTKTGSKEYWHCVVCEKKFSDDQGSKEITDMKVLEIPMEAHTGGTATCTTKAICDVCKKEYGELNISNHGEREVKNRKTATCKAPGYTGDTYCKECDTKIVSGEVIEKLTTHSWDAGKVTKEATCTEKGEITYACTDCGETTTEEIPALSAPKKNAILTDAKNAAKYKVTKAGIQNGTLQYVEPMNKNAKAVRIPVTVTIDGIKYKVTSIAKNAFKNNKRLTEVTIGDNVNIIGTNAFYGCTKLKTVITSKNVTTIGENAFYKCTALEKITISSKVTKIGRNAFYGCKKLKIITIKTKKLTTKNVGSNAFKGIYKKAVIKAPKMKVKAYKTIFKKKGMETMIFRYI